MQGSLVQDNGHSLVPVPKRSGTPWKKTVHMENGTISRKRCCWNSPKAYARFSVLRHHCPEVNSKAKDMENCRFIFGATQETIGTIFRIIVSANQLSLYGEVANMCEVCESLHDRSGKPDMVMGQSIVLNVIKTEVSLDCDDPKNQDLLLQRYGNELKSYHNKINWVNFVWMQDFWVLLKLDSISWLKTLEIDTISCSGLSWIHSSKARLCINPRERQDWARIGRCNLLLVRWVWGGNWNWICEQRQYSLLGQNFSWIK